MLGVPARSCFGGGLRPPSEASPQESVAPAKPALEQCQPLLPHPRDSRLPARRRTTAVIAAIAILASASVSAVAQDAQSAKSKMVVHGAGATLPAPLYERWIQVYRERQPDTMITYEAVGSGEGQRRFLANA